MVPLAAAQPPASDLSFSMATFSGAQDWTGPVLAVRISQEAPLQGTLTAFSPLLHLHTTNSTATAYAQMTVFPLRGGRDADYANASISAQGSRAGVDVVVFASGAAAPTIHATGWEQTDSSSPDQQVRETPYVNSSRPTFSSEVARTIKAEGQTRQVRVEGDFRVSVWSWNLTVNGDGVATGSIRSDVQRDPATGRELEAHTLEQVAQLTFTGGWLQIDAPASTVAYLDELQLEGTGHAAISGIAGSVAGERVTDSRLSVEGSYLARQATGDGKAFVRFARMDGSAELDGRPVQVPLNDAPTRPGTAVAVPGHAGSPWRMFLPWFAGVALVALVLHGPAQSLRFRAIQRRFDDRDYADVLARIDPFTRRRRFRRHAHLLKAVSLLSLHEFREAALFLGTLGPLDGPDPATQAFLRACASAGQGHDAEAADHLADCFRLDPTYREEAEAIPALRGLLPAFGLDVGGTA